jgi:hypothetical protein
LVTVPGTSVTGALFSAWPQERMGHEDEGGQGLKAFPRKGNSDDRRDWNDGSAGSSGFRNWGSGCLRVLSALPTQSHRLPVYWFPEIGQRKTVDFARNFTSTIRNPRQTGCQGGAKTMLKSLAAFFSRRNSSSAVVTRSQGGTEERRSACLAWLKPLNSVSSSSL